MSEINWHNLSVSSVFKELKTNEKGLSSDEAEKRLKKYGGNKLPAEKRLASWQVFINQFKSPLIFILLIATVISLILHEYVDAVVIGIAVFINTIVGFAQELKAEKTISTLKKLISYKSKVFRNGKEILISSEELVPGDILDLDAGDRVPADCRIFELKDFQVNEASLTGESIPVVKELKEFDKGAPLAERKNMVFMGTTVTRGRARVVVVLTGIKTHFGEIAKLVKETKEDLTPLQISLKKFSHVLGIVILAIALFIFVEGIVTGKDIFEMFETSVAVAVASIPEGLIVAMTIILTVGMQKILKKKALVRKLIAAETLGSTSIICTDKTGTLTEGNMRVAYLLTGECDLEKEDCIFDSKQQLKQAVSKNLALKIGTLCNNAVIENVSESELEEWKYFGDPTEVALKLAAIESGIDAEALKKDYERLDEIPFSGDYKFMATLYRCLKCEKEERVIYLKGAPEVVIEKCDFWNDQGELKPLSDSERDKIKKRNNELTSLGIRMLGVAYKEVPKDFNKELTDEDTQGMIFVGFFGLKDPLRKEARQTIELCKEAGIRPIIITGDHRLTVKAIAKEIGLDVEDKNIIEGRQMDKLSDEELYKKVKEIDIYARVSPKHKLRIVDAWQKHDEVVAMLGDGVNDAPALKSADIGVAVGSGTDVAKETADIVLMNDNFKTIVSAVEQGRVIFDNIRKVVLYLVADSFSEMILISVSLLAGWPLPVTALQILYINLITDGFPNLALTFEPAEEDVMKLKPRPKNEPILNREIKFLIFIIGIITDLVLLGIFVLLFLHWGYDIGHVRTFIFVALGIDSLFYVFSCKSIRKTIFHINIFNNWILIVTVFAGFALQFGALYIPFIRDALELTSLTLIDGLALLGIGIFNVLMIEFGKWLFIHRKLK